MEEAAVILVKASIGCGLIPGDNGLDIMGGQYVLAVAPDMPEPMIMFSLNKINSEDSADSTESFIKSSADSPIPITAIQTVYHFPSENGEDEDPNVLYIKIREIC